MNLSTNVLNLESYFLSNREILCLLSYYHLYQRKSTQIELFQMWPSCFHYVFNWYVRYIILSQPQNFKLRPLSFNKLFDSFVSNPIIPFVLRYVHNISYFSSFHYAFAIYLHPSSWISLSSVLILRYPLWFFLTEATLPFQSFLHLQLKCNCQLRQTTLYLNQSTLNMAMKHWQEIRFLCFLDCFILIICEVLKKRCVNSGSLALLKSKAPSLKILL